jgi:WD40 repeat protein
MAVFEGHTARVNALALSSDGRRLVSGSSDRTLRVWDLEEEAQIGNPLQHDSAVLAVAITSNDAQAVSGCADKTLRVWDLVSGQELARFTAEGEIRSCAISADGSLIAAGDEWGNAYIAEIGAH